VGAVRWITGTAFESVEKLVNGPRELRNPVALFGTLHSGWALQRFACLWLKV
jgi:hypothetical protein